MKKILFATTAAFLLSVSSASFAEHHEGGHAEMKAKFDQALQKLPEDKAAMVKETFKEMREDRKENRGSYKNERDEMKAMLEAPDFNKAAFMSKAEAMNQQHSKSKLKNAERIANLAEKLTPEERKIMIEILPEKGGKKGKKQD